MSQGVKLIREVELECSHHKDLTCHIILQGAPDLGWPWTLSEAALLVPWGGTQWRGQPTLLAAGTPLVLNRLSGWPTLATTVPYNPGILAMDPPSKGHKGIGHSISCGGRSWEPVCLVLGRWVKYRDVKSFKAMHYMYT